MQQPEGCFKLRQSRSCCFVWSSKKDQAQTAQPDVCCTGIHIEKPLISCSSDFKHTDSMLHLTSFNLLSSVTEEETEKKRKKKKEEKRERSLVSSPGLNNPSLIYFLRTEYVHVLMGKSNQINYN